jgi:transcriptional regulator with XRE-family HTH domain
VNPYIGGRLRELRRAAGLSQEQLAQRASLTQTHVSRLERDISAPHYSTIFRLARALDVEPEDLIVLQEDESS